MIYDYEIKEAVIRQPLFVLFLLRFAELLISLSDTSAIKITVLILEKTEDYLSSLSFTSASSGIAGMAPFFSTQRLATAFPNRT